MVSLVGNVFKVVSGFNKARDFDARIFENKKRPPSVLKLFNGTLKIASLSHNPSLQKLR